MKRVAEKMFRQKSGISQVGKFYLCNRGQIEGKKRWSIGNRRQRPVSFYLYFLNIKISFVLFLLIYGSIQGLGVPLSYREIIDEGGVQVYKGIPSNVSQFQDRQQEYVTVIDTTKATIKNLTGKVTGTGDAKVSKKILTDFWQDALARNTASHKVKVIVNGAFFSTNDNPTGIAFGLKADNNLITYGYAIGREYPGQIRIFAFKPFSGIVSIQNYTKQLFSRFPEVLGALHPLANKSAQRYLPRTFIGVSDRDNNGIQESVVLYSSNYARQIDAIKVLRNFDCNDMAMLDGGGSTGLIVNGRYEIPNLRPIPHAIAIYASETSSSK